MRIAIVIERFDPTGGGNERSTDQVARGLAARGHEVTILCNESKGSGDDVADRGEGVDGVTLTIDAANGPGTRSASGLRRFAAWAERRIESGGFDVSLSMITAVAADVIEPRGGTVAETQARNIASRHGSWFKRIMVALTPKQRTLLALERRALTHKRVNRIVALSRYVADQLEHHYDISGDRIKLIPNAAEVGTYSKTDREVVRREERQRLGIPNGQPVFVYAAHNHKLKGLGTLLNAALMQTRAYGAIDLMLVGPGILDSPLSVAPGSTDESYRLLGRVLNFHLPPMEQPVERRPWLHLLGAAESLDRLILAADVLVHPTWYDPSSKVVLEALLLGRPAISTLHNGASQWIYDPTGENAIPSAFDTTRQGIITGPVPQAGRVIDSAGNVPALAEAMRQMCDPAERGRCAAAIAAANLSDRISMKAHVEALEKVLMDAAKQR